jgi:hypothetical protein
LSEIVRKAEMKSTWEALRERIRRAFAPHAQGAIDPDLLKKMARGIMTTRSDEIGCDECFEQMDRFVDMELDGKDAAAAMPLVQDHLERCQDCREEYAALLRALKSVA